MFKKYLTFSLTILILNFSMSAFVFAQTVNEKEKKRIEKIKRDVNKFGIGKDAKVIVIFKDGNRLEGYTSAIDDNSFKIVVANGNFFEIPFVDVKQISNGKKGISKVGRILMGIGIGIAALGIFGAICSQHCDNW